MARLESNIHYRNNLEVSLVAQQQRIHLQCRRLGLDPWARNVPWRREWQPNPVFMPGESHGQRSPAGYSPWGHKELGMND